LRVPLALTWTVLSGATVWAAAACSGSSTPEAEVDAALDARALDASLTDSIGVDSVSPVDGRPPIDSRPPVDSAPTDTLAADSRVADSEIKDGSLDAADAPHDTGITDGCRDEGCAPPDTGIIPESLPCLVLVDGSPVFADGADEIIYVTDGGNCPPGDEPLV